MGLDRRLRTLALVALVAAAPASASADTPTDLGLELIPWSKKLAERRYESPRDWDGTIKFFRDKFKGWKTIKWSREVSLPAVKYVHVTNIAENGKWDGINIYALPDGRIRYYLLSRPPKPTAPKAPPDGTSSGKAPADAKPAPTSDGKAPKG